MPRRRYHYSARLVTGTALAGLLAACLLPTHLKKTNAAPSSGFPTDHQIIHALNRLAFGPRPGDIEKVRAFGLGRWVNAQLYPDSVDDSAVEGKLAPLTDLRLSSQELMESYINDLKAKRMNKQQRKAASAQNGGAGKAAAGGGNGQLLNMLMADDDATPSKFQPNTTIEAIGELETAKLVRATESNRQLQEVLVDFWSNHFNEDVRKGLVRPLKVVDERDVIRPHVFGKFRDLLGASAHSPAMMFYLDNASSTRALPAGGAGRGQLLRNRLRRRRLAALGVQNVPAATTQPNTVTPDETAPAMLDPNATTAASPLMAAPGAAPVVPKARKKQGGLNENYAREIMELHTLGVDGGYTQKDVQEVARCFTGWGINRQTGEFRFTPFRHDDGQKIVLGHIIPAGGGAQDGETVLDILASHPSTARFISRELCTRLVSDEPPAALVQRITGVFLKTGGDLRDVVKAIIYSPEFWAAEGAKVKSPFEYAVSSVRALGGQVTVPDPTDTRGRLRLLSDGAVVVRGKGAKRYGRLGRMAAPSLVQEVADMGEPLFAYEFPTGYPERSHDWISTGGLVSRFNFALALVNGQVSGLTVTPPTVSEDAAASKGQEVINRLAGTILAGNVSPKTMAVLKTRIGPGGGVNPTDLAALMIASPEFQRR
ncbi:MAG: DUF1800 domain-containing protein [Armatimonadota bacterium]|nr:DUF1800 domain-containing protein [Armatimonadota bacterium]